MGSRAKPQPNFDLVNFCHKIWLLVRVNLLAGPDKWYRIFLLKAMTPQNVVYVSAELDSESAFYSISIKLSTLKFPVPISSHAAAATDMRDPQRMLYSRSRWSSLESYSSLSYFNRNNNTSTHNKAKVLTVQ